jgi:hypothetical protein
MESNFAARVAEAAGMSERCLAVSPVMSGSLFWLTV